MILYGWGLQHGNPASIFNVIRIAARYDNLDVLENGYGINIRAITEFAMKAYKEKECDTFNPKEVNDKTSIELLRKTQKAATIMQFKLEGQIIKRHPEYKMEDRLLLDKINYKDGTVEINGKKHKLKDTYFPTIDPKNPYELSNDEKEVTEKLVYSFKNSEKLQKHIKFLFNKGSLYKVFNGNLLIHGCVPMNEKGEFAEMELAGRKVSGKEYLKLADKIVRQGFFDEDKKTKLYGEDFLWYLWCGENSPVFCRKAMKTFERYFIEDKQEWKEEKNAFFEFAKDEKYCDKVLNEVGADSVNGHIICGHFPVKFKEGESPVKSNGKLLVIDGGLSKAYQQTTGIAGYTLIYNSYGLVLAAHEPFTSKEEAIKKESDMHSTKQIVEKVSRKRISDTDIGKELNLQIEDLEKLLYAYNNGIIK